MKIDIIFILQILITTQSLFFTFYLLSGKQKKFLRNKILSALTILVALIMIFNWIPRDEYGIPNFNLVFGLAIGPLLYLLGSSLVYKTFRFSGKSLLHFIPFLLGTSLLFIFDISAEYYAISIFVSILTYIILSFNLLRKNSEISKMVDGNYDRLKLNSYRIMLLISFFIIIANIISFILQSGESSSPSPIDAIILFTLLFILINFSVFQALKHPGIFVDINDSEIQSLVRKEKTNENSEELKSLFYKIESIIKSEQLYLNPDFLITDLARKLKVSYKIVSQAINTNTGQNFSEFVNKYRIEKAKEMLEDPKCNSKTVLQVMYESGFNTKSNFNRAFKKLIGSTPSQFRKTVQS